MEAWQRSGEFQVEKRLSISDSSYFFDGPLIVPVATGRYETAVRYGTSDGHPFVAAYRASVAGKVAVRREELGSISVDFGQILICDRDAMERVFDELGDRGLPEFYDQLDTAKLVGAVSFAGVTAPIFQPGFGDGQYTVIRLVDRHDTTIGIEIDCITHLDTR